MFMKSCLAMLTNLVLISSLLTSLVSATAAPKISKNPKNVIAIADFPAGGSEKFSGYVSFSVYKGLVNVHVDVAGLPEEDGPFVYHIHDKTLPENLDCELAGLHLNPYNSPGNCDDQIDNSYCQVGDLSGKHGYINSTCFEETYVDPYLSLSTKSKSAIINKAIVFHYANLTKLACANIQVADGERINTLINDYTEHNPQQLTKLQSILEDFNNENEELIEEFDLIEWDEESGLNLTRPVGDNSYGSHSNVSTYGNLTNFTGQVGDDCENNAFALSFGIPAAIAGLFAGLVI